jgi:hypothetical protein
LAGPLRGKQFILEQPRTTVGSGSHADLSVVKDHDLLPLHARFVREGGEYLLESAPEALVAVNGRPSQRTRLRGGEEIALGSTVLLFELRRPPQAFH